MNLVGNDALIWHGGLNVGLRARGQTEEPPVDQPPVAGPDEAVVVAGTQIVLSVLGNDIDPEGGTLTVTAAAARYGTVAVNPDRTLTYTAPGDFSDTDQVTYTVTDAAGNASEGTVAVEVFILRVTEGTEAGEFVVEAAPGELVVTVVEESGTAEYALRTADLEAGPVNLRPPQISGSAEAGKTLTVEPGLWASDEAQGPLSIAWAWMRGDSPIEGATGSSYVVDGAADQDQMLHVVETASTDAGTRQAVSPAVEGSGAPSARPWTPAGESSLSGWWDASDTASLTVSGATVSRIASQIEDGVALSPLQEAYAMTLVAAEPDFQGKQVLVPRTDWATVRETGRKGYVADTTISTRCVFLVTSYMAGSVGSYADYAMLFGSHNGENNQPRIMGDKDRSTWIDTGYFGASRARTNGSDGAAQLPMPSSVLFFEDTATANHHLVFNHYSKGGATSGPARAWSGPLAEVIVLSAPPSDDLLWRIEGYLAHKWGCGLLPDTHPYKSTGPTV